MKVRCEVEEDDIEEGGKKLPGVRVTCGRCSATAESFGEGERSVKRCLALLRENCQEGEANYYITEDDDSGGRG
jgi:hypothetical protein